MYGWIAERECVCSVCVCGGGIIVYRSCTDMGRGGGRLILYRSCTDMGEGEEEERQSLK
jgi:hypothetical protein